MLRIFIAPIAVMLFSISLAFSTEATGLETLFCQIQILQIELGLKMQETEFDPKLINTLKGERVLLRGRTKKQLSAQRKIKDLISRDHNLINVRNKLERETVKEDKVSHLEILMNEVRDEMNDLHGREIIVASTRDLRRVSRKLALMIKDDPSLILEKEPEDYYKTPRSRNPAYGAIHYDVAVVNKGSNNRRIGIVEVQIRTAADAIWNEWDHPIYEITRILDSPAFAELNEQKYSQDAADWLYNPLNRVAIKMYSQAIIKALRKANGVHSPSDLPTDFVYVPLTSELESEIFIKLGSTYLETLKERSVAKTTMKQIRGRKVRKKNIEKHLPTVRVRIFDDFQFSINRNMKKDDPIVQLYHNSTVLDSDQVIVKDE